MWKSFPLVLLWKDAVCFDVLPLRETPKGLKSLLLLPFPVDARQAAAPAAIRKQLAELSRTAKEHGRAIGIGHPHPATLAELRKWLPAAAGDGIEVVPLSRLVNTLPSGLLNTTWYCTPGVRPVKR